VSDEKNELKLYTQRRVIEMTGISDDQLRTWESEFNIQVPRTAGGHRRYTPENIELFTKIRDKIHENGWGISDIRDWLNGETTPKVLQDIEIRTNVEKKLEEMSAEMKDLKEVIKEQNELLQKIYNRNIELESKSVQQLSPPAAIEDDSVATEEKKEPITQEVKKVNWFAKMFKRDVQ
jgi:DNA-binding transcriptional MerR regulator